jgi:hypothetical protein
MKTAEWNTYRTRFLIKAKQLSYPLSFTDELGRQHSGRKGDYLMESSEGELRIAPRQIFEDIYVSLNSDLRQENPPQKQLAKKPSVAATDGPVPSRRKQPQPSHIRRTAAQNAITY